MSAVRNINNRYVHLLLLLSAKYTIHLPHRTSNNLWNRRAREQPPPAPEAFLAIVCYLSLLVSAVSHRVSPSVSSSSAPTQTRNVNLSHFSVYILQRDELQQYELQSASSVPLKSFHLRLGVSACAIIEPSVEAV